MPDAPSTTLDIFQMFLLLDIIPQEQFYIEYFLFLETEEIENNIWHLPYTDISPIHWSPI